VSPAVAAVIVSYSCIMIYRYTSPGVLCLILNPDAALSCFPFPTDAPRHGVPTFIPDTR
jgi:hypothetical protein